MREYVCRQPANNLPLRLIAALPYSKDVPVLEKPAMPSTLPSVPLSTYLHSEHEPEAEMSMEKSRDAQWERTTIPPGQLVSINEESLPRKNRLETVLRLT